MATLETLVLYAALGCTVATGLALSERSHAIWQIPLHVALWPFFAASLLRGSDRGGPGERDGESVSLVEPRATHPDIRRAERRLLESLERLDGVAEDVMAPEIERVRELADSLDSMQGRLEEMNDLLADDAFDEERARERLRRAEQSDGDGPRAESAREKLRHVRRLREMRSRLARHLETALARIDEITAKIALLRFADDPEREVSELIADIAATVDGVSAGILDDTVP